MTLVVEMPDDGAGHQHEPHDHERIKRTVDHGVVPDQHAHVERTTAPHQKIEEIAEHRRRGIGLRIAAVQPRAAVEVPGKNQNGSVRPLRGGYDEWKRLGYPLDAVPPAMPELVTIS